MTGSGQQLLDSELVVERRIVHHHQAVWPQGGQQHLLDPGGDGQVRASGFKQHRRQPVRAALRHDQIGAVMVFAADLAKDPLAADRPAMRAVGVALKTAFIKIYHVCLAVLSDPKAQRAQV